MARVAAYGNVHSGSRPFSIAASAAWLSSRRSAAVAYAPNLRQRIRWFFRGAFDPNDWRLVQDNAAGIRYLPLTTDRHRRFGTRERVLDVARRFPDRLTISLNTLATRVLLDDNRRAYGVEYRKGARLYRAHVSPNAGPGESGTVYASGRSFCAAARSIPRSC